VQNCFDRYVLDSNVFLGTWFRFEIKFISEKAKLQSKVEKAKKPSKTEEPIPDDYTWHKIICLTHWSAKQNIVFCIATMIAFEHFKASFDFEDLLAPSRLSLDLSRPYAAHALISREIVYLFDDSVWGMRDLTRTAEKVRCDSRLLGTPMSMHTDYKRNSYGKKLGSIKKSVSSVKTLATFMRAQDILSTLLRR